MSSHDELVQAAKMFLEEVMVFSTLAEAENVMGWIIVTYDPETNEFLAHGMYEHPRAAQEAADLNEKQITSDGSPGTSQIVMPLYNWNKP